MMKLRDAGLWLCVLAVCSSSPAGGASRLIDRAMARLGADSEKQIGGRLYDFKMVPFRSRVPGTLKWKAATLERAGRRDKFVTTSTTVLAEFPPGWVLKLEVVGTPDNDALARRILETLRTSAAPGDSDCVWPVLRGALSAGGIDADSVERGIRTQAGGGPLEVWMAGPDMTFIFNFDAARICFTYALPGKWEPGPDSDAWYVSKGGRGGAGLSFQSAGELR